MNLAQTGAEAGAEVMYFKKIVNFAKDFEQDLKEVVSRIVKKLRIKQAAKKSFFQKRLPLNPRPRGLGWSF